MPGPDDRDLDVVRTSARELARRFDRGYWRQKDKREVRRLRPAPVSREMVLRYVSAGLGWARLAEILLMQALSCWFAIS
jgi:DNA-binding transcriptional LysR family regulator